MNILPKKNWHVRKKENIARVRKDEAEAAEIEKEKERRAKLAEQEARVSFLRKRAKERDGINLEDDISSTANDEHVESKNEADIFTPSGNINFFKEAEAGLAKTDTNKEYEEEKKIEKEDYEKKIGLLTYLGQDTLEAQKKTAWFNEREHIISKRSLDPSEENEIGLKSKSKLDPLNEIKKYTNITSYPKSDDIVTVSRSESICKVKSKNLCRKDKKHKKEKIKKKKRKRSSSSTDLEHEMEPKKKKKKKHSKKKKRKDYSDEESDNQSSTQDKLAKLREERLKREAHERKRAERLLAGKNPDVEEKETKSALPFVQKYNSQFNPHIAKQNQELIKVQPTLQAGVKYWLN